MDFHTGYCLFWGKFRLDNSFQLIVYYVLLVIIIKNMTFDGICMNISLVICVPLFPFLMLLRDHGFSFSLVHCCPSMESINITIKLVVIRLIMKG